jgi:hypothetical protein
MSNGNSENLIFFCRKFLPGKLTEVCHVNANKAKNIGEDIIRRAKAFAYLDQRQRDIVIAPFIEEVLDYEPINAPHEIKGAVTVVFRNSQLEDVHGEGLVDGETIKILTTMIAPAVSNYLNLNSDPFSTAKNPFIELQNKYPRAWACCNALSSILPKGGCCEYIAPNAPIPELPKANEMINAKSEIIANNGFKLTLNGIDSRIDQTLMNLLRQAVDLQFIVFPNLSRVSRNSDKLFRVLEYLLANNVTILTANYVLSLNSVCVRSLPFIKADLNNILNCIGETSGMCQTHQTIAEKLLSCFDLKLTVDQNGCFSL